MKHQDDFCVSTAHRKIINKRYQEIAVFFNYQDYPLINPLTRILASHYAHKRLCVARMQVSITTSKPASKAFSAAGWLIIPSCIHTTFAPISIA